MQKRPIIVSACLLGIKTRYDGTDSLSAEVRKSIEDRIAIPVCPEQLAGFSTPRPKAEITSGDGNDVIEGKAIVSDENGRDVTEAFLKGARETLKIALLTGAGSAFLKEKSPSCGLTLIKRGAEDVTGAGVTAALLIKEGLKVRGF